MAKQKNKKAASPPPKPPAPSKPASAFPVSIAEVFTRGFKGYWANIVPLTIGALATLATYAPFRWQGQQLFDDERFFPFMAVEIVGLILAGTVAYPWYFYALDAARGNKSDLAAPFATPRRFTAQAVSSFWFWAGVLLGVRYLLGLPSIVVLLLYAFHGFVIAAGKSKSGMLALGTSVRLGQGRRFGLFAIGVLLLIFNLFGATGIGFEQFAWPVRIGLAIAGLSVTTSVSLVAGAVLFDVLWDELGDDHAPPPEPRARRKKKGKK